MCKFKGLSTTNVKDLIELSTKFHQLINEYQKPYQGSGYLVTLETIKNSCFEEMENTLPGRLFKGKLRTPVGEWVVEDDLNNEGHGKNYKCTEDNYTSTPEYDTYVHLSVNGVVSFIIFKTSSVFRGVTTDVGLITTSTVTPDGESPVLHTHDYSNTVPGLLGINVIGKLFCLDVGTKNILLLGVDCNYIRHELPKATLEEVLLNAGELLSNPYSYNISTIAHSLTILDDTCEIKFMVLKDTFGNYRLINWNDVIQDNTQINKITYEGNYLERAEWVIWYYYERDIYVRNADYNLHFVLLLGGNLFTFTLTSKSYLKDLNNISDLVNNDHILIKVGLPFDELTKRSGVESMLLKLDKNNLSSVKLLVNLEEVGLITTHEV